MRVLSILVVTLSTLAAAPSSAQQTFTLLGEESRNVSSVLSDINQKSNVYKPGEPGKDEQLYFTPFFAFRTVDENQLDVRVFDLGGGKARLSLFLLVSPNAKVDEIARFIRAEEANAPVNPKLKNLAQSQLIPITFQTVQIQQDKPPVIFRPFTNSFSSLPDTIEISADLQAEEAATLRQQLLARKAAASFSVDYTLNARFTASETSGNFKSITVRETNSVQELVGSGRAFTLTVTKPGISAGPAAVTRRQRSAFLGDLRNEIETTFSVENAKDLDVVRTELTKYTDAVFGKPRDIAIGPGFAQELSRLSAYKFSAADLAPDEMDKFVTEWKGTFEKQEKSMTDVKTAGSFEAFEVFGASGKGDYTSDTYKKELEEIGWKFELKDGKIRVPKSLEIYDVDDKKLQESFDIMVKVTQRSRGLARFRSNVSTDINRLNPTRSTNTLLRMEEFMDTVRKGMAALAADHQATKARIDGMSVTVNASPAVKIEDGNVACPGGVIVAFQPIALGFPIVNKMCGTVTLNKQ